MQSRGNLIVGIRRKDWLLGLHSLKRKRIGNNEAFQVFSNLKVLLQRRPVTTRYADKSCRLRFSAPQYKEIKALLMGKIKRVAEGDHCV